MSIESVVRLLQRNVIWIVFVLIFFSTILGKYYHNFFINLKHILPLALFLMLYKPMVYLDIKKAFTKKTTVKTKYILTITILYTIIYPISSFFLMKIMFLILPNIDLNLVAGIVILTLSPIASSAPAFVGMSGGKVQLALIGVIYTFLLSLLVIPISSNFILAHIIGVPANLLIKSLILCIITPLIIGQITKYLVIRYKGERTLERLKIPLDALSLIGLLVMVFVIFGINGDIISKNPLIVVYGVLIMNIYFFLRWGLTYLLGKFLKFPLDQLIALTYSSTYNMTIATAISITTFGPMAAVGTVIGGPFAEMIQMILLVKFFEHVKKKMINND